MAVKGLRGNLIPHMRCIVELCETCISRNELSENNCRSMEKWRDYCINNSCVCRANPMAFRIHGFAYKYISLFVPPKGIIMEVTGM